MATAIVAALHAIIALALIFLILLHAGRGGGMSEMFGGGFGGGPVGSTVVERNLDRITVAVAIAFGLTTIIMLWLERG